MYKVEKGNSTKINRIKWYLGLLILQVILWGFFFGYLDDKIPKYATHDGDNTSYQIIHDFTSDYIVEQSFISSRSFDFITLYFADHDMYIAGRIGYVVYNEEEETLIQDEINCSELKYNQYGKELKISFQKLGYGQANHKYKIKLYAKDTEDVALGIYGYSTPKGEESAIVNGEDAEFAVSIGTHSYTSVFKTLAITLMLIGLIGNIVAIWICTKETITEEKMFLTLVIPFGISMLLFLSGNSVYDADAHTTMAYHYSNVLLGVAQDDDLGHIYMRVEDAVIGKEKSGVDNEQAQEFWRVLSDWNWKTQDNEGQIYEVTMAHGGTILSYLPNIIGMVIGRMLGLGAYPMMYLSKILGFVAYIITCYYAIKVTPVLKTVFSFVAVLPICIYHATGITYDTIALSASLLMCAYIFMWWERELRMQEWIVLAVSAAFIGGCKGGVYLPLLLLMLLVPWKRWNLTLKKVIIFSVGAILGVSLFLIKYGNILISSMKVVEDFSNPNAMYGSGYCFKHPFAFGKMFMETVLVRGDAYLGQLLGDRTAWTQAHIEWFIIIPILLLLLAAGIRPEKEAELTCKAKKIAVLLLVIAEFVGMHIVLMSDTKITENYIYGVQGRYFLPLLPLILLVIREEGLVRKERETYKLYLYYSMMQSIYMLSLMDKFF